MILDSKRTVDPRDNLERAHRRELLEFARASGIVVSEDMPADDIEGRPGTGLRSLLRSKGVTRIAIPHRSIDNRVGDRTFPMRPKAPPTPPPQATSDEWAEFQQFKAWKSQQQPQKTAEPAAPKAVADMSIKELRTACKERGIKMERKDNMETLRAKLSQQ